MVLGEFASIYVEKIGKNRADPGKGAILLRLSVVMTKAHLLYIPRVSFRCSV